jgi:MFS family permease
MIEGRTITADTGGRSKGLVLTAMIFAVAMTFIDQTIVSIAAPTIQHDLGLSSSGMQWAINAYLLALAALFAFGGRLADIAGHRRMVVLGVIIFAGASALCGATPRGGAAEAWLVAFRAVQGAGGAIMFPAAIAIVVVTFDLRSRGRALALFFGVAGAQTAIGPITGGYLIEWTWRAIFWINIPVALITLALIAISKPANEARPAPMDYRGLALIIGGVGLSVFGFQQSALWGWSNPAIWASIAAGVVLLIVFFAVERRTESPLINVRIFNNQAFLTENIILGIAMMAFIPVFFFAAFYGQIALAEKATTSSLLILYFFLGFVVCAQIGGRMLDRRGQAAGRARQCLGGRRVRPVGRPGHRPARRRPGDLHRAGRGRDGADARPGEHRRDQPGLPVLLWRGHRDHPDRSQLRRQPRLRHLGHAADHPVPVRHHRLPHQPRPARPRRVRASRQDRPAAGRQRQPRRHPGLHPRRLRRRHPRRALRHVRHHGHRRGRGAARPQARRSGRHHANRGGVQLPAARRRPRRLPRLGPALGPEGFRDGAFSIFYLSSGGLVISRMVSEFGIAKKGAAAVEDAFPARSAS